MGIYIYLLALIIASNFIVTSLDIKSKNKRIIFLFISFVAIFLIYSLRDSSVGRDVPGYKIEYLLTKKTRWDDYSYVYFENGYIFLMKICNKLSLSFQQFLVVISLIMLVPVFIFCGKYSKSPFLSVMTYICYIFFEFNLTGLRQGIATSIVLIGIMVLIESKRFGLIKYAIVVYIATLFHSGAFIGFLYIPFHFLKKKKRYVPIIAVIALVFLFGRGYIMSFIKSIFGKETMNETAGLYIGANFLFLVGLAVLFIMAQQNREIRLQSATTCIQDSRMLKTTDEWQDYFVNEVFNKMFLLSICSILLFGSDNAARSYMILCQVVLALLPNCIEDLVAEDSKGIVKVLFVVFMIAFFFSNTLLANNFDIVPYKFFWQ